MSIFARRLEERKPLSVNLELVDMHLETRILFSLYWLSSGFEADSG
jgi:hypothetical protein